MKAWMNLLLSMTVASLIQQNIADAADVTMVSPSPSSSSQMAAPGFEAPASKVSAQASVAPPQARASGGSALGSGGVLGVDRISTGSASSPSHSLADVANAPGDIVQKNLGGGTAAKMVGGAVNGAIGSVLPEPIGMAVSGSELGDAYKKDGKLGVAVKVIEQGTIAAGSAAGTLILGPSGAVAGAATTGALLEGAKNNPGVDYLANKFYEADVKYGITKDGKSAKAAQQRLEEIQRKTASSKRSEPTASKAKQVASLPKQATSSTPQEPLHNGRHTVFVTAPSQSSYGTSQAPINFPAKNTDGEMASSKSAGRSAVLTSAQQNGGVVIGGKVIQSTNVQGGANSVNIGNDGKAQSDIGSISGNTKIGNNVIQNSNVQGSVNSANSARGGCSKTSIGSISNDSGCLSQ
ncbi:MAG: hypothetical protein HQL43_04185 [Alphaproteobacteria bacterium]|nr:hypothetical protein [Alphaproteobacteria bacterium]